MMSPAKDPPDSAAVAAALLDLILDSEEPMSDDQAFLEWILREWARLSAREGDQPDSEV